MNGIHESSIRWDGTDLGPIDEYLNLPSVIIDNKSFTLNNNTTSILKATSLKLNIIPKKDSSSKKITKLDVKFVKYKDNIPLISDKAKFLFYLPQLKFHKCSINGQQYLMTLSTKDITLNEYMKTKNVEDLLDVFIDEVRRIFVYRWLMCFTKNTEENILVRSFTFPKELNIVPKYDLVFPMCFNENTYDPFAEIPKKAVKNSYNLEKSRIPNTIIKKWFNNDLDLVEETKLQLIGNKTALDVKYFIERIIKNINSLDESSTVSKVTAPQTYESWTNVIYERMLTIR